MDIANETPAALRRSYLVGYGIAIVLTAIPFGVVALGLLDRRPALILIAVLAIVQVLVHLRYFLHIDFRRTPRENILVLGFAAVLICIMIGGTLWIMLDLHHRMML
ncbi:cytochrome o ubiquinol oxidase subunit IV [Microbaculum marinum]|uniref:Cytochrome bo(3) ubiquinol oxidase subunit 4 n=1 Tax=Microbaculum marinum TaxID=1764581 RepID=A0AAW9RT00_9HYPH